MPLPQPFPLPPMCDLPENELVYPGERLLLLFQDGKKISGQLMEYIPEHHEVVIKPENEEKPFTANLDDLKMMALPGVRPYVLSKEAMEMSNGEVRWHTKPRVFEIVFNDGNSLLGKTLGFRFDQNGIFLFPAQEDGGFKISFITRVSMKTYNIGPRIGEVLVQEEMASKDGINSLVEDQKKSRSKTIGRYLRDQAVISADDLEKALIRQKEFPDMKLGEILLGEGLVTEDQLMLALRQQQESRDKPLGQILVEQDVLTRDEVQLGLAKKMGVPFVDLKRFEIDQQVVQLIDVDVAREHHLIPLYRFDKRLVVAIEDPLKWRSINTLRFLTRLTIEPVMASPEDIDEAIDAHYADVNTG